MINIIPTVIVLVLCVGLAVFILGLMLASIWGGIHKNNKKGG